MIPKETKEFYKNISSAIFGYKVDFKKIFVIEDDKDYKFSLSDKDIEGKMDEVLGDESLPLYKLLEKIYAGFVLGQILSGENTEIISDAMVARYDKHKKDLAILKTLFKLHFKKRYKDFFNEGIVNTKDEAKKAHSTYALYIKYPSIHTQESLLKEIKTILDSDEKVKNYKDYDYVVNEINEGTFLPKLRVRENGAIPYQLHSQELKMIIDNQSAYYPVLRELRDKLVSLVEFRIPYYVGPLSSSSDERNRFSWMKRKSEGKIFPWNFEEKVDIDASAELFIERMRNKCTYLPEEDVIPKYSLLYSEYEVLSEINQITINGKRLSKDIKTMLLNDLFKTMKKVSKRRFIDWLKMRKIYGLENSSEIEGFQADDGFASSLDAFIDFTRILGGSANVEKHRQDIEKIILWISLFEDKLILRRKLGNEIEYLTPNQVDEICRLNYRGWSRLSRKLLTGLKDRDKFGNEYSIMDYLRNSDYFFMQLITNDRFRFKQLIEKEARKMVSDKSGYNVVNGLPCSPSVKKGIWQSLKVVEEIVKVMGADPRKIYVEFAREDQASSRTKSRYNKLDELYSNMKNDPDFISIYKELKTYSTQPKALDDRALYLYFTQNGKCMYSGKPLDISSLSSYQIDHIIPQSYVKDDSLDNLVLVISAYNQRKLDSLLIDDKIQQNMKSRWAFLYANKFISKSKYDRLLRDHITDNQLKGFISRQIVETRQIVKHTTNIFKEEYTNTQIYAVKAAMTSNMRIRYGLYKNRNINNHHHAHDAFLAATMGQYILKCYPFAESELDYEKYKKSFDSFSLKDNFGVVVDRFGFQRVDKDTGEIIWDGEDRLDYMRRALNYKDCFISRKVETETGQYYNETLYSPRESKELIPINSRLDPKKYGGYRGIQQSYYCIIEYTGKKKRVRKLVGIPIKISDEEKSKPGSVHKYLERYYPEHKILKNEIKKYQRIIYEGNDWFIVSDNEVINAKELILPNRLNQAAYHMNRDSSKVDEEMLDELYNFLYLKIMKEYPVYAGIAKKLREAEEEFNTIDKADKIAVINQVFIMLQANSSNGNFTKFNLGALKGREGRLGGKNLDVSKIEFIDSSVTGIYERRYRI